MTQDNNKPISPAPADPQPQEDADASDSNEPGNSEGRGEATQYRIGSPHSKTVSLDDIRRETAGMDDEAKQRAGQQFLQVTLPLIQSQIQDAARVAIEASKTMQSITLSVAEVAAKTFQFSDDWSHYVAQQLKGVLEYIQRLPVAIMRTWGPPNWGDLTDDELKGLPATALAGIPVAWVPRTGILRELIAAPDHTAQLAVIEKHGAEIVDDCAAAVAETRTGSFSTLASAAAEAVETYRAGHRVASQALSASVLDTLFRAFVLPPMKQQYYPTLKTQIKGQPEWLPDVMAQLPALQALENFDPAQIPTIFNRHASAHAVSTEQYSNSNALVSLMLATSLLRDAHHVEDELPDEDDLDDETDSG